MSHCLMIKVHAGRVKGQGHGLERFLTKMSPKINLLFFCAFNKTSDMYKTYIFGKVCISATCNNKVPSYIMDRSMVFLVQRNPPTDSKDGILLHNGRKYT